MKKALLAVLLLPILTLMLSLTIDTSAAGLKVLNLGIALTQEHDIESDIAYGDKQWQMLDVYSPIQNQVKRPVIVFFYGGGWSWGDKSYFKFIADTFVRKGYVVVNPDYALYPQSTFPSFVYDGAKAVKWVVENIEQYKGDPDRIYLVGHSAGAYNSVMLASDDKYLDSEGLEASVIKGLAGVAGPYNFTPKAQEYINIFGRENFEEMQIAKHVNGNEPPMLLMHSKGDTTVGLFNLELMTQALDEHKMPHKTVLYDETIDHVSILLKMHPWFADDVSVADDIDNYFSSLSSI